MRNPDITVTEVDFVRLKSLLATRTNGRDQRAMKLLDSELSRARIVPQSDVPANVVTMHSRFRYLVQGTEEPRVATLVYPEEADYRAGRMSVLAPAGSAILGLAAGQKIGWPVPSGAHREFGVVELLYQPEAAGDLHL